MLLLLLGFDPPVIYQDGVEEVVDVSLRLEYIRITKFESISFILDYFVAVERACANWSQFFCWWTSSSDQSGSANDVITEFIS